ncbi:hypothetical protein ACFYST_00130 [Kitasatospora sp. NPDC004614]|uniref:hypothetical protein n=1 Tax=unclassified Kitasatospora TaxID=2633591 RepID=UPI0036C118BF
MDALTGLLAVQHRSVPVVVHRFTNADGDYYSADPDFHPDGRSTALNIYPATGKRIRLHRRHPPRPVEGEGFAAAHAGAEHDHEQVREVRNVVVNARSHRLAEHVSAGLASAAWSRRGICSF